jgi:hypothetical protein
MLPIDLDDVRRNASEATTEDLLDRATVYRNGMETDALDVIEEELRDRGITPEEIAEHAERHSNVLWLPDGTAQVCSLCRRPAVAQRWGWRQLRGAIGPGVLLWWLPIPWFFSYCESHLPGSGTGSDQPSDG